MSGYDSPFHLAEECSNASIASPRAIFMTSAIGGIVGWFLQLVVAYTVVDITAVLESDLGQPFAAFLNDILPQRIVLAVLSLTIIAGFAMGQGCMIAASRVTYVSNPSNSGEQHHQKMLTKITYQAYARDECFPLSRHWRHVNTHTRTPVNAVWLNSAIGTLLLLLIFGGDLAIGAIFSIGACAAFVSFTIPIAIRVFFVGDRFRQGPWNLGRFSVPIGVVGLGFVTMMVPVLCLPSVMGGDLDVASMNWTALVYGGPMAGVLVWWVVDARRWFKGPRVNVEHLMGREVVLQGELGEESVGVRVDGGTGSVDTQAGDSKVGGL
jgi:amino acid transporter